MLPWTRYLWPAHRPHTLTHRSVIPIRHSARCSTRTASVVGRPLEIKDENEQIQKRKRTMSRPNRPTLQSSSSFSLPVVTKHNVIQYEVICKSSEHSATFCGAGAACGTPVTVICKMVNQKPPVQYTAESITHLQKQNGGDLVRITRELGQD